MAVDHPGSGLNEISAIGKQVIGPDYRLTRLKLFLHKALGTLPPVWREWVAEHFVRRTGAPGPAAEHVIQYLLSGAKSARRGGTVREATVAKGADNFYQSQYRQQLNTTMGAFAMTATQVLVGAGRKSRGWLFGKHRQTTAALIEQEHGNAPILVLNAETIAVPLWLPSISTELESTEVKRWWSGRGAMPEAYRNLMKGKSVSSAHSSVKAFERDAAGATLEVVDAVLENPRLALLALHPHDPDAMGLHITLYGVELLEPNRLQLDYGLDINVISAYEKAAQISGCTLLFAVGGTEEVFTQCSQNLFVKRPVPHAAVPASSPVVWTPAQPLEDLLRLQFELIQITVSASGLPGASPRNGDKGKAAFVCMHQNKVHVLIPYHPGNYIHGHAAKLWSNPYGTLVISDDHASLCRVIISGASTTIGQQQVEKHFPKIAAEVAGQRGRTGKPVPVPEYWFLQEVSQLVYQRERLSANLLAPGRETCSISAGGQARHNKKPAYFAANNLPQYDSVVQHERELAGRPMDPTGVRSRAWQNAVAEDLAVRKAHLDQVVSEWSEGL